MSALLLGFVIGAVFYVFGGRDSALGDLELPQRLGLVAVVGVVLLLVAMLFSNEAPEGAPQPAQQELGRSAPQDVPATSSSGQEANAGTATAEPSSSPAAPAVDEPPAAVTAAPESEPAAEPAIAAAPEAETASEANASASATAAAEAADSGEAALQCVYSPDSGRCTCLDERGYLVEVELERCRELATPDAD